MSDLEVRLVELGGRLDHPEGSELLARVHAELDGPTTPPGHRAPGAHRRRVRRVLVGTLAAAVVAVVSLPASRTAIADFFRVDGVELRSARDLPAATPSSTTLPPVGSVAAAQRQADFTVRVARSEPAPEVTVDRTVPGGLVTLDYPDFRVVELAAPPDGSVMAKFVDRGSRVASTQVGTSSGYWITGTHHQVTYLDRDKQVRTSTMHTTGHILLWSEGGVTIRVEGPETQARAQAIAASLS